MARDQDELVLRRWSSVGFVRGHMSVLVFGRELEVRVWEVLFGREGGLVIQMMEDVTFLFLSNVAWV